MVTVQLLTQLFFTQHYDAEVTRLRSVTLSVVAVIYSSLPRTMFLLSVITFLRFAIITNVFCFIYRWYLWTEIFRKVATNISLLNYSTPWIAQLIRRYIQRTHPICLCEHLYTKRQFPTVLAISFWHINQSATLSIDGQFYCKHIAAHFISLHVVSCHLLPTPTAESTINTVRNALMCDTLYVPSNSIDLK